MENPDAVLNVGICYLNGFGTQQDKSKSVQYFQQAIDMGNINALVFLGLCYEYGDGVPKDITKALELYQQGASMGDSDAKDEFKRLKSSEINHV